MKFNKKHSEAPAPTQEQKESQVRSLRSGAYASVLAAIVLG